MTAIATYRMIVRVRNKAFSLAASRSFAAFGRRTVLCLPVRIAGERRIALGAGVHVGAGSCLQALEDEGFGLDGEALITIGDRTSIAGNCTISAARHVLLGTAVLLGRGVYIADHDHAYADASLPVLQQGIKNVAAVEIADGAWLGQNVVICPGVTIGAGAVIAANSVVKADVGARCMAAGAPARTVRSLDRARAAVSIREVHR